MKILIVDDSSKNIQFVANILVEHELSFAISGEKALEMIQVEKFDLVLLDVIMNGIDGYTTCERLRKEEDYLNVPVIFLTAKTESEHIDKVFDVGGQDYISKPFNTKALKSKVDTFLKLKKYDDLYGSKQTI